MDVARPYSPEPPDPYLPGSGPTVFRTPTGTEARPRLKVYITGCINRGGRADPAEVESNLALFDQAEVQLLGEGYAVVNVAHRGRANPDKPRSWHMRHDFLDLLGCQVLYRLPNWTFSPGAMLEFVVAREAGLDDYETGGPLDK